MLRARSGGLCLCDIRICRVGKLVLPASGRQTRLARSEMQTACHGKRCEIAHAPLQGGLSFVCAMWPWKISECCLAHDCYKLFTRMRWIACYPNSIGVQVSKLRFLAKTAGSAYTLNESPRNRHPHQRSDEGRNAGPIIRKELSWLSGWLR